MKIIEVANRNLTEQERASMEQFRSYTDGVGFVCLREGVMVIPEDGTENTAEKLTAKALEQMQDALYQHPDMHTYQMCDGCTMVALDAGIFAFSRTSIRSTPAVCFLLRENCLNACDAREILAVALSEIE